MGVTTFQVTCAHIRTHIRKERTARSQMWPYKNTYKDTYKDTYGIHIRTHIRKERTARSQMWPLRGFGILKAD